ncbi:MAG: NAD-dependent succinate-semialdehyde dehydrogenase [Bacteroidales bacterium]|nr:NAD-dependent succinate-semialdehyde dehydrogenase [Bacteroidales bacterium]
MKKLKSIDPYTLKEIGSVDELTDTVLDQEISTSKSAFHSFRKSTFGYRAERMFAVAALLKENASAFAGLITAEMGKLTAEAEAEVKKCAWVCEYYAENAADFLKTREERTDAVRSYIRYEPIGPVLAVMPWNFPFWQVFRFAAPTLMAGNTGLLKHASNVQGCAAAIEDLFLEAGFPAGVFINLAIGSSKVPLVISNDAVRAVTLTGSEPAGSAVASEAGRHIKKSLLELGGNNAFVVLKDADLDLAVNTAVNARLINCGQSCIAAKRFIIEDQVFDPFLSGIKKKVMEIRQGDPSNPETGIGPLFSTVQADELEFQVADAVSKGAVLETGGKKNGAFFEPTILTNVKEGMAVFDEETFGPVFAFTRADSMEHALELSNQSEFGLGMQVFTSSGSSADYFIENANEGAVFVNGMVKSDPRLPFGGVKHSGFGRELSREGILEFVNVKTIWQNQDMELSP